MATNLDYLDRILAHAQFAAGDYSTAFLDEQAAELGDAGETHSTALLLAAAALSDGHMVAAAADMPRLYAQMGAWRN